MYTHVILHLLQVPTLMITKNEIVKLSKVISELSKVISELSKVISDRVILEYEGEDHPVFCHCIQLSNFIFCDPTVGPGPHQPY